MPFFVHRTVGKEILLSRVDGDLLRIGRGTDADLRFHHDAAVDLAHAHIRQDEKGYLLVDEGSVTGTYLNGQAIEKARLSNEDRIGIGGQRLRVQLTHRSDPLFLHVTATAPEPAAAPPGAPAAVAGGVGEGREVGGPPALSAPRVDYAAAYGLARRGWTKPLLAVALAAVALVAVGRVVVKAWAGDGRAARPGPVSQAHAQLGLGADCAACHAPWRGVASARCEAEGCHPKGLPHQQRQAWTPPCRDCHSEHRGLGLLARVADRQCLACHRDLTVAGGGEPRVARRTTGFGDHPEFRLPAVDQGTVGLNHQVHLKPDLRGSDGRPTQLDCSSCHVFEAGSGRILPLSFEEHCQACHDLIFDQRFPDTQAPHGSPDEVWDAIRDTYREGAGGGESLSDNEVRSRIFRRDRRLLPDDERIEQQAFPAADQLLRNRCKLCHRMEIVSVTDVEVAPPAIRQRWLEGARFSHRPHRSQPCGDCHTRAAESKATADVLIPGRQVCMPCHGEDGSEVRRGAAEPPVAVPAAGREGGSQARGSSPTSCVTCHDYHPPEAPPGGEAQGAGEVGGAEPAAVTEAP